MDKQVYKARIAQYLESKQEDYGEYLRKTLAKYSYVCVFGVGNLGLTLPEDLEKIGIITDFFCDNDSNKTGQTYRGVPCISVAELELKKQDTMVLIATRFYKEIYRQLKELGFPNIGRILDNKFLIDDCLRAKGRTFCDSQLQQVLDLLADETSCVTLTRLIQEWCRNEYEYGQLDDIHDQHQYFPQDVVKLDQHEIFVDCGAYDGDTLKEYMQYSKQQFDKMYLFELSSSNYQKLQHRVNQDFGKFSEQISMENVGVGGENRDIYYCEADEGSDIYKDGTKKGRLGALDELLGEKKVTYIKMDIEGAELEALQGGRRVLEKHQPKLAICLYHRPEDMWEIPLYIHQILPNHHIYIRHHTDLLNETVCYAIP